MQDPLLPLFPLGIVLLPEAPLALHIFEERYKEMIGEAISAKSEFGVVHAADEGIQHIGCSATIQEILHAYPDGRMDVLAVGRRRFEIVLLDDQKPFLRAAVSFFDDDEEEPASMRVRAVALAGFKVLLQTGTITAEAIDYDDPKLSFKIARYLNDLELRQQLLVMRSETERLRRISDFLPTYIARVRRTEHVKRVAPTNGHGLMKTGAEEKD